MELRAWQERLPALRHRGAQLVAISPQSPGNSLTTAEKNQLAFPVLSDTALQAVRTFGIDFTLRPNLVDLYASVGNDLPVINNNGLWVLPIPATYVIDRQGRIAFAHIEADYRERAEPDVVLDVVGKIRDEALMCEGGAAQYGPLVSTQREIEKPDSASIALSAMLYCVRHGGGGGG